MKAEIRILQLQELKKIEVKGKYIIENVKKITEINNDHLLHGTFKKSGEFSIKIHDVFGYFFHKEKNNGIDLIISKSFIKNKTSEMIKDVYRIDIEIDLFDEYVFNEKKEGFYLIRKTDYPIELLNSTFVK
jgi:hypothetical protein